MRRVPFLVVAPCVLFAPAAAAADRLVATPADFAAAVKAARAGDRIVLKNGEWRDFAAVFTGEGTAERPITLAAETKGRVVLTGASSLKLGGRFLVVSGLVFRDGSGPGDEVIAFRTNSRTYASDSRLTEVVIDGFNKPDRRSEDIWVALYGQRNRVDHSHFEGKRNAGVTLAVIRPRGQPGTNDHRIDHNYFGPRPVLGSNGGETIRIGTSEESLSDSRTIVERNIFEGCDGEVEIVSVKSGANVLRENLVIRSAGAFVLRHGNGNLVERNVFFGHGKPDTGGVRVINRDQVVRHNYMEGLAGKDMKSALTVMNGVPNSVINRYHQVVNALIERNSILDSARVTLAAGADEERSAPPLSSRFERNLITGAEIVAVGDATGIGFAGNVQATVAKPFTTTGLTQRMVKLTRAANGLLYPSDPALAEVGAPRDLKPVTRAEVGASWYRSRPAEAAFGTGRTIRVAPGASLARAVASTGAGDTVALAPGRHEVAAPIAIRHRLTIAGSAPERTQLRYSGPALFQVVGGGGLELARLGIAAAGAEGTVVQVAPSAVSNYALAFRHLDVTGGTSLVTTAAGTFANRVAIDSSRFRRFAGAVIDATAEQGSAGLYPVEEIAIRRSSFEDVGMVADVLRRGTDESTFGPKVELAGSTIVGARTAVLRTSGAQHVTVSGNRFVQSAPVQVTHSVGAVSTRITDNTLVGTPAPKIVELAYKGPQRAVIADNRIEAAQ